MYKNFLPVAFLFASLLFSCSRKHHPSRTVSESSEKNTTVRTNKNDTAVVKKVFKPKQKDLFPKTITVNDKAAHKSVDGRLYYDLMGHRYWKNYRDGKYYIFNQSMYSNDDFKAPVK